MCIQPFLSCTLLESENNSSVCMQRSHSQWEPSHPDCFLRREEVFFGFADRDANRLLMVYENLLICDLRVCCLTNEVSIREINLWLFILLFIFIFSLLPKREKNTKTQKHTRQRSASVFVVSSFYTIYIYVPCSSGTYEIYTDFQKIDSQNLSCKYISSTGFLK